MSTRTEAARFILREATALGIRVGSNGIDDLVVLAPLRIPRATRLSFEKAVIEYEAELIEIVWREGFTP
jgi:hypothetical protein